jgi:hypothetical protein
MSKPDAERAMEIYRNFTKQTDFVVSYLSVARQYEHQTRVEVPKLKHAPVNLGKQLEDYLMDPDFEVNRRQYLAEQESKGGKSVSNGASKPFAVPPKSEADSRAAAGRSFPDAGQTSSSNAATKPTPKAPDADLIDFFDSIDSNPEAMSPQGGMQQASQFNGDPFAQMQQQQQQQQQQLQVNGFAQPQASFQNPAQFQQQQLPQQQAFNTGFNAPQQVQQQPQPMQPMQPNFTGAGFGGYTPQQTFQPSGLAPIPQDSTMNFQQQGQQQMNVQAPQQTTNPFRQTMMTGPSFPASPPVTSPVTRQSTNPFAKSISPQSQPYTPPPDQQFQPQQTAAPLRAMQTGTNPFAKNLAVQQRPATSGASLAPQPTGNTNPFRQSQFVNTATGMGWQNNQQPIGGGLDHLETVPVFPRPAQQQAWQQ